MVNNVQQAATVWSVVTPCSWLGSMLSISHSHTSHMFYRGRSPWSGRGGAQSDCSHIKPTQRVAVSCQDRRSSQSCVFQQCVTQGSTAYGSRFSKVRLEAEYSRAAISGSELV